MMQGGSGDFAGTIWVVTDGMEKRLPKWMRLAAYAPNKRVYIPASMAGNEKVVFMCACYDGISCIIEKGHIYAPTDWMSKEFPSIKETCVFIESRVKSHVGTLRND